MSYGNPPSLASLFNLGSFGPPSNASLHTPFASPAKQDSPSITPEQQQKLLELLQKHQKEEEERKQQELERQRALSKEPPKEPEETKSDEDEDPSNTQRDLFSGPM